MMLKSISGSESIDGNRSLSLVFHVFYPKSLFPTFDWRGKPTNASSGEESTEEKE